MSYKVHCRKCLEYTGMTVASVDPPAVVCAACKNEAVKILDMIDELRAGEGDSVTLACDNPDFTRDEHHDSCIEVFGDWTNWHRQHVYACSVKECLQIAVNAKNSDEGSIETDQR